MLIQCGSDLRSSMDCVLVTLMMMMVQSRFQMYVCCLLVFSTVTKEKVDGGREELKCETFSYLLEAVDETKPGRRSIRKYTNKFTIKNNSCKLITPYSFFYL